MSFSFTAVGARTEVVEQLAALSAPGNKVGELARQLVAEALGDLDDAPAGSGFRAVYIVRASGHSGGGSATSLNLVIEPQYVPDTGQPAGGGTPA